MRPEDKSQIGYGWGNASGSGLSDYSGYSSGPASVADYVFITFYDPDIYSMFGCGGGCGSSKSQGRLFCASGDDGASKGNGGWDCAGYG